MLVGQLRFQAALPWTPRRGRSNWVYETGNYINGSPAVADGRTVFGGCDGLLHVISLADGKQVKEIEAGAYIAGFGGAGGRARLLRPV